MFFGMIIWMILILAVDYGRLSILDNTGEKNSEIHLYASLTDVDFDAKFINADNITTTERDPNVQLNVCPLIPSGLGPLKQDMILYNVYKPVTHPKAVVDTSILSGGRFSPSHCVSRSKVAIIIPLRFLRYGHLYNDIRVFITSIHKMLQSQLLDYRIFLMNQTDGLPYNQGQLYNVGFQFGENVRPGGFDCYVFQEMGMLPMNTLNMYSCTEQPTQLCTYLSKSHYKIKRVSFGAVTTITKDQFTIVNGFSNRYSNWDDTDMDMYERLKLHNMRVYVKSKELGSCLHTFNSDKPDKIYPQYSYISPQDVKEHAPIDGLNSLIRHEVTAQEYQLCTLVSVRFDSTDTE